MTFGQQNSEAESHAILDEAVLSGINFIDVAELYPVPVKRETAGLSEVYVGTWLAKRTDRSKLIIATKVAGYSDRKWLLENRCPPSVGDLTRLDFDSILAACDGSLKRLQTSYIDLYQIHWPDRYVPGFGASHYDIASERKNAVPIEETLRAIKVLLESGKIKHYGVSNETTWGIGMYMSACAKLDMPGPISIQNSYSLVHRQFESELAEACSPLNCNIGLLAWSPLAGGYLTGKYLKDTTALSPATEESRFNQFASFKYQSRFYNERTKKAAERYAAIASKYNITPTQLALAFCRTRFFMASIIFGCTSIPQLKENLSAFDVTVTEEMMIDINEVYLDIRDPTCEERKGF
jgi:aryl-alcohol dehydrogenase-like predicted oxidoreductase